MHLWRVVPIALLLPLAGCFGDEAEPLPRNTDEFAMIVRGDPSPQPFDSCIALLETLNERAERHAVVALQQSVEGIGYWRGGPIAFMEGDMAMADGAQASSAPRAADAEVTGTNNQEAAADEADILKTDGEWTYIVRHDGVYIFHSENVGDINLTRRIDLDAGWNPQLLLEDRDPDDPFDDRLLVIMTSNSYERRLAADAIMPERYFRPMVQVQVYDISDRMAPMLESERFIEGDLSGARLIDGVAHIVVHAWEQDLGLRLQAWPDDEDLKKRNMTYEDTWEMNPDDMRALRGSIAADAMADNRLKIAQLTLKDHLPSILLPSNDGLVAEAFSEPACRRVLATDDGTGRGVSTIYSADLEATGLPHRTVQVMGSHPIVYGSGDALVLAEASQDFWWFWAQPSLDEATNLHWFDLSGLAVTHRASGRVDGIVQDQFGIDVHADTLRVATTTGSWGRWWLDNPDPMANHLVVFEAVGDELVEKGKVSGIAPGERLWSARFTDDRAYLVTFEQIDPLWVIDLQDPADPTILGELEIPGVSTYIHPLSDDALLTIGMGPGPDGLGLDWSSVQVSLFDISDPTDPQQADVLKVTPEGGWSWSGALHEHKAFTYWDALGVLAVPVTTHNYQDGWSRSHAGLKLVDVDTDAMTLSIRGEVDHDIFLGLDRWGSAIERSYFLGFPETGPVSVYSVSQMGFTAHDLDTLDLQDGVSFPER